MALWFLGVIAVAIVEFTSAANGIFVYQSLPVGTIFREGTATLPDGKVVPIDDLDPTTGRRLAPWEIDWSKQTAIRTATNVRWLRLSLFALLTPVIAWLIAEAAVVIVAWVVRGFKGSASGS